MSARMDTASELLADDGPISELVEGFAARDMQQEMADVIADVMAKRERLVCEAGTGTGKTFAYLVPVIQSGQKVIISTGTKNLQDQLFTRDLPMVRTALGSGCTTALLKGRANYLCLHRMEQAEGGRGANGQYLATIREWAQQTRDGDIAELVDIPEDAGIWPSVTSTAENCLGQECARFKDCHVLKARKQAIEADILVINHHLFFADMALRGSGFGEILPGADVIIFDEAHQLPDIASQFLGISISSRQVTELARDAQIAGRQEALDSKDLAGAADALTHQLRELRLTMGLAGQRGAWNVMAERSSVTRAMSLFREAVAELMRQLEANAERGKDLQSCFRRSKDLAERLGLFIDSTDEDFLQWFETTKRGFLLHLTPIEVAETFRAQLDSKDCAWIFTSATLAVAGSFEHFAARLGLDDARMQCWDSPFDYRHQALMYLPPGLPEPRADNYTAQVVEAALPVIEASGGRTFFLFTSYRALKAAAEMLADRIDYPMLVHGTEPRAVLLERFRELKNAVLLGTTSFWQGVDVRGEALSCVIIDKLPFASPDDPLLQARFKVMQNRGEHPFMNYQVPQAVVALKQGAGRLIRDFTDRGVLMLCDPRLLSKGYGKLFLRSLPNMPQTRDIDDVEIFFSPP